MKRVYEITASSEQIVLYNEATSIYSETLEIIHFC